MASNCRSSSFTCLPTSSSSSFSTANHPPSIRRPGSNPDLFYHLASSSLGAEQKNKLPQKLLLNVTVQRSLGPVQVVVSPESRVRDLIKAAMEAYVKEGRRPLLEGRDPEGFRLHYSQFSFECLNPEEKLMNLGSRNFFLCSRDVAAASAATDCRGDEGKMASNALMPRSRFMDFFLKLRS